MKYGFIIFIELIDTQMVMSYRYPPKKKQRHNGAQDPQLKTATMEITSEVWRLLRLGGGRRSGRLNHGPRWAKFAEKKYGRIKP